MQPAARATLLSLVEDHLSLIIREACSVNRHAKRARLHEAADADGSRTSSVRRRLHAADVNMALQLLGSEKLYAVDVVHPDQDDEAQQKKVDLAEYLRMSIDSMPLPPSEVGVSMHWLAVDGTQPDIPQNPAAESRLRASPSQVYDEDVVQGTAPEGGSRILRVNHLQASLLSEELQLYFSRLTLAMERGGATAPTRQQQDAVLLSLSQDPGLQELLPFLVRYFQQEVYTYIATNTEHCRSLVRLAQSLLTNPQLHLELHLHEMLPALMTCVVAQRSSAKSNHWSLRREASRALTMACEKFGEEYPTLKSRVLRTLCEAISPGKGVSTRYGGIVAISLLGCRAIDSFLLPVILSEWSHWEATLELASVQPNEELEIHMCQQASLEALGKYLNGVNAEEQSLRLDREQLEFVAGERLVALQNEPLDYAMVFV